MPALAPSDAALLAALLVCGVDKHPTTITKLLEDLEWQDDWWPDYDDLSYGLPRLIAHGYLRVTKTEGRDLRVEGTPLVKRLVPGLVPYLRGYSAGALAREIGAERPAGPFAPDRSAGRLAGFSPDDYLWLLDENERRGDREVDSVERAMAPLLFAMRVLWGLQRLIDRIRGRPVDEPVDEMEDPDFEIPIPREAAELERLLPDELASVPLEKESQRGDSEPIEGTWLSRLLLWLEREPADLSWANDRPTPPDGRPVSITAWRVRGVSGQGLLDAILALGEPDGVAATHSISWDEVHGRAICMVEERGRRGDTRHSSYLRLPDVLVELAGGDGDEVRSAMAEVIVHIDRVMAGQDAD